MAQRDQVYAIFPKSGCGAGFTHFSKVQDGRLYREIKGYVETPHGFVQAYSTYFERGHISSCLKIIKAGKCHYRFFDKEYTARGLVTKAKLFANEVFKGGTA